MHVRLAVGESGPMGSDTIDDFRGPHVVGTNFSVSFVGEGKPRCDRLLAELSEGGDVTMPMQETFWPACFGSWRDRFRIDGMVGCDLAMTGG